MQCFSHNDNSAIATCSSCSKGICQDCFTLIEGKSCCGGYVCKQDISIVKKIINSNALHLDVTNQVLKRSGFVQMVLGFIFMIIGLFNFYTSGELDILFLMLVPMGVVFLLSGIFSLRKKSLYNQSKS